jgi:trans-2,3-dihydro-3-hydroxyanthranilate isomerase
MRPVNLPLSRLAAMVSLPEERLGTMAPWMASVGLPFFCLPLADRDAVATGRLDLGIWEQVLPPGTWARDVYVVAGDFAPGGWLKVRMWAPADGVPEDPATGSAAAMLVGSLAGRLPDLDGRFAWTIEQGTELGRPSIIEASAEKRGGKVVAIRVGGGVAIVGEGAFNSTSLR